MSSMTPDEMALEAWPIGSRVIVYEDGVRQDAIYEVVGAWRGDLRLRHVDSGTTFCTHPRNVADAASCDNVVRAKIEELTDEHVTDEEASAVLAWCREWVADCGFDDVEDALTLPDAVLLAGCHRHIGGGLPFVLASVLREEGQIQPRRPLGHGSPATGGEDCTMTTFYVLTVPARGAGVFGKPEEKFLACGPCVNAALRMDPTGAMHAYPCEPGCSTCELHYEGVCAA